MTSTDTLLQSYRVRTRRRSLTGWWHRICNKQFPSRGGELFASTGGELFASTGGGWSAPVVKTKTFCRKVGMA